MLNQLASTLYGFVHSLEVVRFWEGSLREVPFCIYMDSAEICNFLMFMYTEHYAACFSSGDIYLYAYSRTSSATALTFKWTRKTIWRCIIDGIRISAVCLR